MKPRAICGLLAVLAPLCFYLLWAYQRYVLHSASAIEGSGFVLIFVYFPAAFAAIILKAFHIVPRGELQTTLFFILIGSIIYYFAGYFIGFILEKLFRALPKK